MRKDLSHLEQYRCYPNMSVIFATTTGSRFGMFMIPFEGRKLLLVVAKDDQEWEHVSVSLGNRCPNWKEMSMIKDLFWDEEDTVIQFHPKKSEYVNNHPYCLHLWKWNGGEFPTPPSILVGLIGAGTLN